MQLTFTEMHTPTVGLQIQVDRQLYTEQSDFQRIDVFECEEFGRFLTLDGYMMLTERDEKRGAALCRKGNALLRQP